MKLNSNQNLHKQQDIQEQIDKNLQSLLSHIEKLDILRTKILNFELNQANLSALIK